MYGHSIAVLFALVFLHTTSSIDVARLCERRSRSLHYLMSIRLCDRYRGNTGPRPVIVNSKERELDSVTAKPSVFNDKDDSSEEKESKGVERDSDYLRFGRSLEKSINEPSDNLESSTEEQDNEKRYIRFGKRSDDEDEKRYIRFGRSKSEDDKRYMRFGKRYMRFGKRRVTRSVKEEDSESTDAIQRLHDERDASGYLRFGRNGNDDYIRFGRYLDGKDATPSKRYMRFGRNDYLRFGRLTDEDENDVEKRYMRFGRFMRFGKDHRDLSETPSGYLRFGRDSALRRYSRDLQRGPVAGYFRFGR